METSGESNHVSLPPALLAEVKAAAEAEHQTIADFLGDLVRQGLSVRRWKAHAEEELQRAREAGLPEHEPPKPNACPHPLHERIAQGMRSLRGGHSTDGEAFMTRMDAELAEQDRQARS